MGWEYLTITASRSSDGYFRPIFINDIEVPDSENSSTLLTYLNQLGSEGWELVSEQVNKAQSSRWEYMSFHTGVSWEEVTFKVDNETYTGRKGILQYLNKLGRQGWEMFAVSGDVALTYHFKREDHDVVRRLWLRRVRDK